MLTIDLWRVKIIHSEEDFLVEELWCEDLRQVRMLVRRFIKWVAIVHAIIGIVWFPFINGNKLVVEDLFSIHADQSSIHIVSDSATIITIGNQTLDSWPWNGVLLIK